MVLYFEQLKLLFGRLSRGAVWLSILVAPMWLAVTTASQAAEKRLIYRCENLQENGERSSIATKLYQGYDGFFFRRGDLETFFELPQTSIDVFVDIHKALEINDIHLLILPMIPRGLVGHETIPDEGILPDLVYDRAFASDEYSYAISQMREAGLDVIDITEILDEHPEFDPLDYSFSKDIHWSPSGSALVAAGVTKRIASLFPEQLKQTTFESRDTGKKRNVYGELLLSINEACQDKIPGEIATVWQTTQAVDNLESLFGDAEADDERDLLHVVGTSFSDEALIFHFSGALRQQMGRDHINFARAGGGISQSIYWWTQNDIGMQRKPRVLLWEYSYFKAMNKERHFFRNTVLPALYGPCAGGRLIAEGEFSTTSQIDISLGDIDVMASSSYIRYAFSNAALPGFKIQYIYADGEVIDTEFTNPDRVFPLPEFYRSLPENRTDLPQNISMTLYSGQSSSGTYQVCTPPNWALN